MPAADAGGGWLCHKSPGYGAGARVFAHSVTMITVFAHQGVVIVTVMSGMSRRPVCEGIALE